jgi:hypothetical protein
MKRGGAIGTVSSLLVLVTVLPAAPALAGPLTWSSPRNVDGTNEFSAVSCPSMTLCVAVDAGGNVVTSTSPASSASGWKVSHVDSSRLTGVSCWSTTQCAAVDKAGNVLISANPTGGAAAWSSPKHIATRLDGISCATEFLCVAIDMSANNAVRSDNAVWPPSQWYATPLDAEPMAVSCASASLCAIAAQNGGGYVITSTNPVAGTWKATFLEGPYWVVLEGVSCTAPSLCVAIDNEGNVLTSNPTSTTSTWGVADVDGGMYLDGVSCATTSFCVAVDSDGKALSSTDPTGGPSAWDVTIIDGSKIIPAVSCPSTLLCIATDEDGNVIVGAGLPLNTSAPVITGTAAQGHVLTEQHGTWTNSSSGYTYQWLRCDGSGASCAAITGATNQAYTPTAADVGSSIRVAEVASNPVGGGNPATSGATGVVQSSLPANTAGPVIIGTAAEGRTLTAQQGAWTNDPSSFTYRWLRCDGAGANCAAIAAAVEQAYTLTAADVGATLRIEEVASNAFGSGGAVTSPATGVVQSGVPWSSAPPAISGAAVQDHTLTAVHGAWQNSPTDLSYKWLRCDGSRASCAAISGATKQAYTLTAADVGSTIRVQEVGSNAYGTGGPATSAATSVVKAAPPLAVAYNAFFSYDARSRRNRATRFRFSHIPRGAKIEVRCHGKGCPFERKRLKVKGTRANLLPAVRRARLTPHAAYFEVRISASGYITEVLRFTAAGSKGVTVTRLCVPPGHNKPRKC